MSKDDPKYDRLLLSKERIETIASDIETVASLPYSQTKILEQKKTSQRIKYPKDFRSIRSCGDYL